MAWAPKTDSPGIHVYPVVSIVVPARNEESNIGRCLGSLVSQEGLEFEIIVVDDDSTDRTAEIASQFSSVRVISARPLPAGWTGKANAIVSGASIARGSWYLFTDADTTHLPGSLARSVAEAEKNNVILLSYSPAQESQTWWEKIIQPLIFAELAKVFNYDEVSDPQSSVAAANGQYILFERGAYQRIGGHASVRGSLLEDVELARLAKSVGRIRFRFAPDAVVCRMYMTFSELRDGWSKNLAILFRNCRVLAVQRALECVFLLGTPTAATILLVKRDLVSASLVAVLACGVYVLFVRRLRRAGFKALSLFSALGLPVYAYLLLRSAKKHREGRIDWKGRVYRGCQQ